MKYTTLIPTVLHLLCQQEQHHEVNLINRLNAFFGFDHNIFFVDSTTDLNRYIPTKHNSEVHFTSQTIFNFNQNLNYNNKTQPEALKSLTGKNTFLIVIANTSTFRNETDLWAQVRTIRRLDKNVKISIFFVRYLTSMDMVEQLFQWSWSTGILNIFCAFYYVKDAPASALKIFRFEPFPKLQLIDVTESVALVNYFPDKVPNYRQHPIRFVRQNLNWATQIQDNQFWKTVVHVFNASQEISSFNETVGYAKTEYVQLIARVHDQSSHSYPHRMTSVKIVVPHALPYSNVSAYLQNGTWTLLLAYAFGVIVTASLVLIVSGYLQTKKILFFQRMADVINLLMNDNSHVRYAQLHRADVWVVVPLTFTGLIVANGVLSVFKSYITLPMFERQIKSLDDLYKSPFNIIVTHYWVKYLTEVLEDITQFGRWNERVREVSVELLYSMFTTFNTSTAYFVYSNQAKVLMEAQRRLDIKAYYLLTNTFSNTLMSYDLYEYYPFFDQLKEIIHRSAEAGLMDQWFKAGEGNKVKFLVNMNLRPERNKSSDSDGFTVFTIVWSGWIASTIVFACEIIWKNLVLMVKNRFERSEIKKK